MKKTIENLIRVRLSLYANPYNEPNSEMNDNVNTLSKAIRTCEESLELMKELRQTFLVRIKPDTGELETPFNEIMDLWDRTNKLLDINQNK